MILGRALVSLDVQSYCHIVSIARQGELEAAIGQLGRRQKMQAGGNSYGIQASLPMCEGGGSGCYHG